MSVPAKKPEPPKLIPDLFDDSALAPVHQTPDMVAAAAAQESVDAVGLSIMSGAHMTHFPAVRAALDARGANDVVLFGGGIVPDEDAAALKGAGIAAIFTPGTSTQAIVDWIERELRPRVEGAAA